MSGKFEKLIVRVFIAVIIALQRPLVTIIGTFIPSYINSSLNC